MLKNYINNINIRNFKQSGYYMDFLVKKTSINIIKNLLKVTLIFSEKYIVEFLPKNFIKTISFKSNTKNRVTFNFFNIVVIFINLFLIILFL